MLRFPRVLRRPPDTGVSAAGVSAAGVPLVDVLAGVSATSGFFMDGSVVAVVDVIDVAIGGADIGGAATGDTADTRRVLLFPFPLLHVITLSDISFYYLFPKRNTHRILMTAIPEHQ